MKKLIVAAFCVFMLIPFCVDAQSIYAPDGRYLGNLNRNTVDPNSVSNPVGIYGSPVSPYSINNPVSPYGSPISPYSPNNPLNPGIKPQFEFDRRD